MYALFVFVGQWAIAGIDEHEECAVMFIDQMDSIFGDGAAFVAKLPDKSDYTPIADAAERHLHDSNFQAMMTEMKDLEQKLERNEVDLDEAFRKLTGN